MNDQELTARAREAGAKLRRRPGDLDRLAGELLAELADRLDGQTELDRQEAIAAGWHQRQAEGRSDLEGCAAEADLPPI